MWWPWRGRRRAQVSQPERRAEVAWASLAMPIRAWSIRNAVPIEQPDCVVDLTVDDGRFVSSEALEECVDLDGAWWFPGLVNGHDHLGFSNAPLTAVGAPYASMTEWAAYAKPSAKKGALARALRVPLVERLWIGMVRNLLSGATTAVHHDPAHSVMGPGALVHVPPIAWTHSLTHGQDPERAYASRTGSTPFVLHLAEGTDRVSREEYDLAVQRDLIGPGTVIVHGVALTVAQMRDLAARGGALVWCPSSNQALYGKTLDPAEVPSTLPLMLGTDSPLSGGPLLLEEARVAVALGFPEERLLAMLTEVPGKVFCTRQQFDADVGAPADGFAIERRSDDPVRDLLTTRPEQLLLVVSAGRPLLVDASLEGNFSQEYQDVVFRHQRKRVRTEVIAPIRHLLEDESVFPDRWTSAASTA